MLDEVVGGLRLAGPRPDQRGGEHDWLRTMAPRTLRRLRGSGWLVAWDNPHGAAPDVLWKTVAENEGAYFGSVDSFVRWYTFTALAALDESRADKNRRRHARLAETRDGRCPHAALEAGTVRRSRSRCTRGTSASDG